MEWQQALLQTIKTFDGHAPEWGTYDCCQFVARYVERVTGVDHTSAFQYTTEQGAARILVGAGGMESLISRFLGEPKKNIDPGDVVLCALNKDDTAYLAPGVTNGSFVWAMHPDLGIARASNKAIIAAWSCRKG